MLRISNVKLPYNTDFSDRDFVLKSYLKRNDITDVKLMRRSVDARKKGDICFVCTFDFCSDNENLFLRKYKNVQKINPEKISVKAEKINIPATSPVIVGSGPAGLFAALTLAQNGLNPVIIERGDRVENRIKAVDRFTSSGILNTECNIQFGEGGAGTFSDGKLNTGIKDKFIRFVLETFFKYGANEDILYSAKPHIGTDVLRNVIKNMREDIISLGGKFLFNTRLCDIEICDGKIKTITVLGEDGKSILPCDSLFLAIGHSARDTFEMLKNRNIAMERKPFAVGLRIEHPQEIINTIQYGDKSLAKYLGAADYKLAVHLKNGRSLYSFCMCPGGYVVAAASEKNTVVTNGMSRQKRDNINANSALLVGISPSDFGGDDVLAGMYFQRKLEQKAFELGGKNYSAPVMVLDDFLNGRESVAVKSTVPTYTPGVTPCDFRVLFPSYIYESLKAGILEMDKKMSGFLYPDALLTAVESRSSSPVRILRSDNRQSVSLAGLYPCGEGSGYAGGIMSAAVDGIKSALALLESCK